MQRDLLSRAAHKVLNGLMLSRYHIGQNGHVPCPAYKAGRPLNRCSIEQFKGKCASDTLIVEAIDKAALNPIGAFISEIIEWFPPHLHFLQSTLDNLSHSPVR